MPGSVGSKRTKSVTAYSRDLLLQAKEIAERQGYRMLHAIVDSLWLVKPGAVRADYDGLAQAITERTELSIGVEGLYHWIGFLPSRVNPLMPVPNQFVGLFDHGAMKIRGIEIRRSDAPFLVKRAQAEVLRCLSEGRTLAELLERFRRHWRSFVPIDAISSMGMPPLRSWPSPSPSRKSRRPIAIRPCR